MRVTWRRKERWVWKLWWGMRVTWKYSIFEMSISATKFKLSQKSLMKGVESCSKLQIKRSYTLVMQFLYYRYYFFFLPFILFEFSNARMHLPCLLVIREALVAHWLTSLFHEHPLTTMHHQIKTETNNWNQ